MHDDKRMTLREWCHKFLDMCSECDMLSIFDILRSYAAKAGNERYRSDTANKKSGFSAALFHCSLLRSLNSMIE